MTAPTMLELLRAMRALDGTDLHITAGIPPAARVHGRLVPLGETPLMPEHTSRLVQELLTEDHKRIVEATGQCDLSYGVPGLGRFRVNAYRQRSSLALAARWIPREVPTLAQLHAPSVLRRLSELADGLVVVTGPTGSGKSTTLAAMIAHINATLDRHIITLEHPIEYLHSHARSIVNQREIGVDTVGFAEGLRAALRQDPDVIVVGEMRDLETISVAVTASETGHLVLGTLHTHSAIGTVQRIVDMFPAAQHTQIRGQLAAVLQGVVSQRLLPRADKPGRVAAHEVLIMTPAIRNAVRQDKLHQVPSMMQSARAAGMQTLPDALEALVASGTICADVARPYGVAA